MLPVIQHNPENWRKCSALCMRCGENDARTGLCRKGIHHASHVNAGYCPIGDFGLGSNIKPEGWPDQEYAGFMVATAEQAPAAITPATAKRGCCGGG